LDRTDLLLKLKIRNYYRVSGRGTGSKVAIVRWYLVGGCGFEEREGDATRLPSRKVKGQRFEWKSATNQSDGAPDRGTNVSNASRKITNGIYTS